MKHTKKQPLTQLGYWLRAASPEQREQVAKLAKTTVPSVYSLAWGHRANPSLHMAYRLVEAVREVNSIAAAARRPLPEVTLEDIRDIKKLTEQYREECRAGRGEDDEDGE